MIARHYEILNFLRFDRNDPNISQDYDYYENENGKSRHKYIATAVEALLAAIYLSHDRNTQEIFDIAKKWKELIDQPLSKEAICN